MDLEISNHAMMASPRFFFIGNCSALGVLIRNIYVTTEDVLEVVNSMRPGRISLAPTSTSTSSARNNTAGNEFIYPRPHESSQNQKIKDFNQK